MPTQPETAQTPVDWAPHTSHPRRSVFGNYEAPVPSPVAPEKSGASSDASAPSDSLSLQSTIDLAVARCFLYGFLARAFEDPTPAGWQWLCHADTRNAFASAIATAFRRKPEPTFIFVPEQFDRFHAQYVTTFGHAARGGCPLNEVEYGDLKADPLFQPHRLADLAAFYRAFGLELAEDADERQDHICLELEFMSVLAARDAYSHEHQADAELLAVGRETQRKFLREHLGRWLPAFTRRLTSTVGGGPLASLADFARCFILEECARSGVAPGSDDLFLRPVDADAENLCGSCGLTQLPPGATAMTS